MTTLQSKLTDIGSLESQSAVLNGWYIKIVEFGVSETLGAFDTTRNIDNINSMFALLPISSSDPINNQTRQLNLTIPPHVIDPNGFLVTSNKNIREVYLFAETIGTIFTIDLPNNELIVDATFYNNTATGKAIRFTKEEASVFPAIGLNQLQANKTYYVIKTGTNRIKIADSKNNANSNLALNFTSTGSGTFRVCDYYLYAFGQFTPDPLPYVFTGATSLRGQLTITNMNTFTIQFTYTQATEISDHNLDPNAHPAIQTALNFNGIYVNDINFVYKGQNYIKNAVFHASVNDNDIVYLNTTSGIWYPALAGSGASSKYRGLAKLTENKVILTGAIYTGHGFSRNQDIYLSGTTAGALTTTPTAQKIGYSIGAGILVLSSTGGTSTVNTTADLADMNINNKAPKQVLIVDPTGTTSNFINALLPLSYLSDVDDNISPTDKHNLYYDATANLWKTKQLGLSDLANTSFSNSLTGKYLRNNGTNWVDSDLQIAVSDSTNSYQTIKSFVFGTGFIVTQLNNVATINFTGSGGGLSAVKDDPTPKLGGDLDVFNPTQLRALISYTTLSNTVAGTTFTDNNSSVNFLATPNLQPNDVLHLNINGVDSYYLIASIVDAHNLIVTQGTIPILHPTDTISYEIYRQRSFKLFNSNPASTVVANGTNTVFVQGLEATLNNHLVGNGFGLINFAGNIPIAGDTISLSGDNGIVLQTGTGFANASALVSLQNWVIPRNTTANQIKLPSSGTLPSVNQVLGVVSVSGNLATLGFINQASSSTNITDANTNNGFAPMVFSSTQVRGFKGGSNVTFTKLDSNGQVTNTLANTTDYQLKANANIINASYNGATVVTASSHSTDTTAILAHGIRSTNSTQLSVSLEVSGNQKNIVLTPNFSGGGGGGLQIGNTYSFNSNTQPCLGFTNSSGVAFQSVGSVEGFKADGDVTGFHSNGNITGLKVENSTTRPIQLVPKTASIGSTLNPGIIAYFNANVLQDNISNSYNNPEGLYVTVTTNLNQIRWAQIQLSGTTYI